MIRCWAKLFVASILLALALYYFFASVRMLFVMIPVVIFEVVGYSLYLNELNESGAKFTFNEGSYLLMVLFWVVVTGFISWLLCKMKFFSEGSQNE